jgi:hypothetical protein
MVLILSYNRSIFVFAHSLTCTPFTPVVVQKYELCFILEGKMRLYIQHGAKLIYNQLGCLYRHFGANSDGAACFLICTSLISQLPLLSG